MLALAEVGVAHALFDPVRWREFYAQGGDGIAGLGHGLAAEGAVGVAGLQTVAEGQVVGDGAGGEAAVQYQVRGEEFEKAAGEVGAGGALGQHETRGGGEQAARVGKFGQAELEV